MKLLWKVDAFRITFLIRSLFCRTGAHLCSWDIGLLSGGNHSLIRWLLPVCSLNQNHFLETPLWNYSNFLRGHWRGTWSQQIEYSAYLCPPPPPHTHTHTHTLTHTHTHTHTHFFLHMLQLTHPWPPAGRSPPARSAVFLCTDQFGWSTTVCPWDIWRTLEQLLRVCCPSTPPPPPLIGAELSWLFSYSHIPGSTVPW